MTKEFKLDLDRLKAGEMPVTRDGRKVRIISTEGHPRFPVVGFIEGELHFSPFTWTFHGRITNAVMPHRSDIGHPPKPIKIRTIWWAPIYTPDTLVRVMKVPLEWTPTAAVRVYRDETVEIDLS